MPSSEHTFPATPANPAAAPTPGLDQLSRVQRLAALSHDIGKATQGFDGKLRRYLGKEAGPGTPDPVRHELIGLLMLIPLANRIRETGHWSQFDNQQALVDYFERDAQAYLRDSLPRYQAIIDACSRTEEFRHDALSGFRLHDFDLGCLETDPSLIGWLWLVLTHHKLPANVVSVKEQKSSRRRYRAAKAGDKVDPRDFEIKTELTHYVNPYPNEDISPFFTLLTECEAGAPWHNKAWCTAFMAALAAMEASDDEYAKLDLRSSSPFVSGLLHIARPAVLIGDHMASSLKEIGPQMESGCYANTGVMDDKVVMADLLDVHLLKSEAWSQTVFNTLFCGSKTSPDLPRVDSEGLSVLRTNEAPEPYDWQNHISQIGKMVSPDDGLIAMVNAGTGTGKTRGCIKLLAECAGKAGLRASLALGLRSLADQGYRDYTEFPISLPKASVGRLIGSYYPIEVQEASPGTSASEANGDRLISEDGLEIPPDAFIEFVSRGKNAKLMPRAVTSLTIDYLIDTISLHRPSASYLTYHLLQTDIIIDEIDNLSAEDLIFVEVLVYLMGLYGRKVVLASATLNPIIAKAMGDAYAQGFSHHKALFGERKGHLVMVSSQAPYYSVETLCETTAAAKALEDFSGRWAPDLNSRHRPNILSVEEQTDFEGVWQALTESIKDLSSRHQVPTDSGVAFSSGFVRFNLVEDAQAFARHLSHDRDQKTYIEVVCYHSKNTAFERYFLEYHLNHLAKRNKAGLPKQMAPDIEAGFRAFLARAKSAGCKTACLVVSTTSLIEVGRDHDYDWAILEPASMASFLQSIGRVLRHRKQKQIDLINFNILVLSHPLSGLRNRQHLWSYPGIETPSPLVPNTHYQYMPDYPLSLPADGRITSRLQGLSIMIDESDAVTLSAQRMLGDALEFPTNRIMTRLPARQSDYPEYAMSLLKLSDHLLHKSSPLGNRELRAFNAGNVINEDFVRLEHKLGKALRFRGDEISRELVCLDIDGNYRGEWQQFSHDYREQGTPAQPYLMGESMPGLEHRYYLHHLSESRANHLQAYQKRFRSLDHDSLASLLFGVSLRAYEVDNAFKATGYDPLLGICQ